MSWANGRSGLRDDGRLIHVALAAILIVGSTLRLLHANADFWFDEIVTLQYYVRPPLARTLSTYIANNHVMNSVLAHLLVSRWGDDPWVVRLPAIAFGIAGIWAFWLVSRQVWPRTPALLGTSLFAVSYYDVYYSQNARGYSGFLFFGLLATALLLELLRTDVRRRVRLLEAAYVAAIGLGLYSMVLMAFIAAGQALMLVAWRRWRLLACLGAGVGLAALLYAPMARDLIAYYRLHPEYTGLPLLSAGFVRLLAPILPVLLAGGLSAAWLIVRLARRRLDVAALLVVPLALNVVLPLARGQGVYPRTFFFGLAVAYFLLVEALDLLLSWRPLAGWLGAGVIATVSVAQLVPYYRLPKQGFRQAVEYVASQAAPADQRIGLTLAGKAARFYDPTIVLVESVDQLRAYTQEASRPAWILSTFPGQMRSGQPDLLRWLQRETSPKAAFPGVIGDGTVRVSYWTPVRR